MLQRPLFVTRKFPPMVGGMETFSAGVWRSVGSNWEDARLIANRGPQTRLVWWLPVTMARVAKRVLRRQADFVLVGDALTYTVLRPLLALLRVPHATLVMGLDITWRHRLYRALAHRALRRAPLVLAISTATARTAVETAGVDEARVKVLRLGIPVPPDDPGRSDARAALGRWLGLDDDVPVVVTVGRLVRRKGAEWFVENVLPALPDNVMYLVAGEGPDHTAIHTAAERRELSDRVRLLGRVSEDEREMLLRGSDVFIQPNVPVPNDMEGFGLVTVEAAMRGTLTLASDLEGISDAVQDGETGVLLPPQDAAAWTDRLAELLADRAKVEAFGEQYGTCARAVYGEEAMARSLRGLIEAGPAVGPSPASAQRPMARS